MRSLLATAIVMLLLISAGPVFANPPQGQDENRGWTFTGRFQGTLNDSGLIMKVDPSLGYSFNQYLHTYVGLPVYFVRESSTLLPGTSPSFAGGIGNAYAGLELSVYTSVIDYVSRLEITAPTGDESRGFSTGLVTVDWNNTFSRTFEAFTPYASVGIANTVSDTSFFVRPFSSDGLVSHLEGGAFLDFTQAVGVGGSGYAVRGSGDQRILSRVIQRDRMTLRGGLSDRTFQRQADIAGLAELANDHGFAAWLSVSPKPRVGFQAGYNRSVLYDLNSFFWGMSFRLGH